jgi:hypothetical protein
MARFPYVDGDQCQFAEYGCQKPTRFFGSDHIRSLAPVRCDRRTCSSLVEDPDGRGGVRRHKNHQGGHNRFIKTHLAYRFTPKLVEYVTGLSSLVMKSERRKQAKRWKNEIYAVQAPIVTHITQTLSVQSTFDAFSQADTARFPRWWGPGSSEAEDAFSRPWAEKILWLKPPFSQHDKVITKILDDRAHAVLILPEWPQKEFFNQAKALEVI